MASLIFSWKFRANMVDLKDGEVRPNHKQILKMAVVRPNLQEMMSIKDRLQPANTTVTSLDGTRFLEKSDGSKSSLPSDAKDEV